MEDGRYAVTYIRPVDGGHLLWFYDGGKPIAQVTFIGEHMTVIGNIDLDDEQHEACIAAIDRLLAGKG